MADVRGREVTLLNRGSAFALRMLGALSIAAGVLVGGGFAYVAGTVGIVVGLATAAFGVGVGALLLRGGARRDAAADSDERTRNELALLRLAESKGGVLRVTDVSRAFHVSAV